MSHVYADRVREIATTTGTGTFALGGEKVNYIPFSDVCGNNDTVHYCIALAKTLEWEVGIGTWKTGGLLERTTILSSSNNNLIVDFSAGVKDVYMVNPASQIESYAKHRDTRPYKSLWEYIPSTLWDSIVAETITTDLKTYIQDAIDDGYPIVAPNGLYPMASAIKLKTGTSIRSLGASGGAIFQAKSTMTAPVLFDVNDLSDGTDVWAQSNILLDGITLDGQSRTISSDASLMRFYSVDGLTIQNCTVKNQLYGLVAIGGCRDVSLSGLRFRNWGKTAVTAEGGPGLWIGGNTVGGDDTVSSRIRGYDLDFSGGEWAAVYDFSSDSEFFGVNIEDVKESGFYYQGNWSGNTAVDGQPRRHLYSGFNIKGVTRKNISSAGLEIAGDSCIVTNFNISDTEDAGLKIQMLSRNVSVSQGHIWDTVLAGDSGHPNYFATYATYGQIQLIQAEDIVNHDVSITGVTVGRTDVAPVADYALRIANINPTAGLYWQHLDITGNNFTHGYSVSAISVQSGAIDPADTVSAICDNIGAADVLNPFTVADNAITNAKLRNSAALSVIGRSANSTGDPADIATAADYDVLRRSGTTLGFGKVDSRSLMGGGDFVNMVQNPRFEQGDIGWVKGAGWAISSDPSNSLSGNYVAINTSISGAVTAFDSNMFDVAPGDILYGEVWIKTAPGVTMTMCRAQIYWFDKDLTVISNANGNNFTTDQASYVKSSVTTGAMPSNAAYAFFRVAVAKTVGTVYANNVVVLKKRDGGQLISTFSTNQIISVTDNTNAALRITQLGTGHALLVEDSANPDATPWLINATGQVIHGYTGSLAIAGANYLAALLAAGSFYPQAFGYTAASATGPMVSFVKSRNADWSARAAVNNGDVLGGFYFAADDGTDLASIAASIQATIDAAPGTDDVPGRLTFATTADGGNSPTNRLRIDSSGNILNVSTGGLGFGTGSGGAVTQATNRTTGVTLDKTNGAITLVSAAGSTSWATFTVTNNTVAATDVVIVSQKSGADLYEIHVTAVAAGSFNVTFRTTGGTTTEQPVFNFAVIKAVTA